MFAHPAKHSLSPTMHNTALEHLGIAAQYEAKDVAPQDLQANLEALRTSGAWGVNLSIPHKETVLEFLDSITPEARAIGAVNTIVVKHNKLKGLNTDAPGFMQSLREAGLTEFADLEVVILGAGGAARGIVYALQQAEARVQIHNRTWKRAEVLATDFDAQALTDSDLRQAIKNCDLLVNTTSVGLENPNETPTIFLPKQGWVCDIVYKPLETKLLRDARATGLHSIDGLGMLVHQGALALEHWIGQPAPIEIMRSAAMKKLGY